LPELLSYKALVCQSNELHGTHADPDRGWRELQTSAQRAALYLHRHNEEAVAKASKASEA